MNVTYLGPAANLFVGNKQIQPGDTAQLDKAVVDSLVAAGHRFEETVPKEGDPVIPSAVNMEGTPLGDDGTAMEKKKAPAK